MRVISGRWYLNAWVGLVGLHMLTVAATAATAPPGSTRPCRIEGMPNEMRCGVVQRALDPEHPGAAVIDVHYLVVPAMARNKQPDAVLLLAGGPGQSAMGVAAAVMPQLARLNHRRDLVFIDQRGTGRSAPLQCEDESNLSIQQQVDSEQQLARLRRCSAALSTLPYGDLRFFTTTLAIQDFDAVREQLGVPQWNLIGASYGTRAALEYLRQFPQRVRRTVIDGVAPPDMVLPQSFSTDGQAALDGLFTSCEADVQGTNACAKRYPALRREWSALLRAMPRSVVVNHPATGKPETVLMTRDAVLRLVRAPLYAPSLASGLPHAIHAANEGNFAALVGLSGGLGSRKSTRLATGMHFSVVCAEDVPRMAGTTEKPGDDFGRAGASLYESVCSFWPRGLVAPAYYTLPVATSPVLVLSGGSDPATPPRHGERVARALGAKAQHIVVPQAGHGVMGLGCMRDVVVRFVAAPTDAQALPQDALCATGIPRPGVFLPIQGGATNGAGT